jgi:hypothetical protein
MQKPDDTTTVAGGSPVERGVRPLAGPNVRRMLRAARLCEELGHGSDTLAALEELKKLRDTAAFYRRRVQALEQWQSRMRDPERTVVCDILANGFTLDPPVPRDRYEVKA